MDSAPTMPRETTTLDCMVSITDTVISDSAISDTANSLEKKYFLDFR